MSLQIIKNDAKQLTKGEEKVFNRVKSIYKNVEYVGMTRASEQLFIHASNYNKDSFAQQLLKLYKTPVIV